VKFSRSAYMAWNRRTRGARALGGGRPCTRTAIEAGTAQASEREPAWVQLAPQFDELAVREELSLQRPCRGNTFVSFGFASTSVELRGAPWKPLSLLRRSRCGASRWSKEVGRRGLAA